MGIVAKKDRIYPYEADILLQSKGVCETHIIIKYNDSEGEYFDIHVEGDVQPTISLNEEQLVQLLYACRKLKEVGKNGIDIFKYGKKSKTKKSLSS